MCDNFLTLGVEEEELAYNYIKKRGTFLSEHDSCLLLAARTISNTQKGKEIQLNEISCHLLISHVS